MFPGKTSVLKQKKKKKSKKKFPEFETCMECLDFKLPKHHP